MPDGMRIKDFYQAQRKKFTSEASTVSPKKPERSGGIFLAKTFSFGSFSFWSQKENEHIIKSKSIKSKKYNKKTKKIVA
jgi:hypothetical protein